MSKMSRREMTDILFGAVHSVNIEAAEKCEPVYTLAEALANKNVTALRRIGKLYRAV